MSTPLHPLATAWFDDQVIQAHRLSRWIVDYVDLEESLAVGSMAQDLLAHAAVTLEHAGISAAERDELVYGRPATGWAVSRLSSWPAADWPQTVVRQFLFAHATLVLLDHDRQHATRAFGVPDAVTVIAADVAVHRDHWRSWVGLLSAATPVELAVALADGFDRCSDLLAPPTAIAVDEAGQAVHAELRDQFTAAVGADLAGRGVPWPGPLGAPTPRDARRTAPEIGPLVDELQFLRRAPDARYEVYP